MRITKVRLQQFRNFGSLHYDPHPHYNLIIGKNGQGKTNLIESIFFASALHSFRDSQVRNLIQQGERFFTVKIGMDAGYEKIINVYWSEKERKYTVDQTAIRKASDFFGQYQAVIFSSQDRNLIIGNAGFRRKFLDFLCSQLSSEYLLILQVYQQALKSRNTLLKEEGSVKVLSGFTQQLMTSGDFILNIRKQVVHQLGAVVLDYYGCIAPGHEVPRMQYVQSAPDGMNAALEKSAVREKAYQTTLVGPHRDDIQLSFGNRSAGPFGSEGQQRTYALSLKLAQAKMIGEKSGERPVMLLDDVMNELDEDRRSRFLNLLGSEAQVFITGTSSHFISELNNDYGLVHIENGHLVTLQRH